MVSIQYGYDSYIVRKLYISVPSDERKQYDMYKSVKSFQNLWNSNVNLFFPRHMVVAKQQ